MRMEGTFIAPSPEKYGELDATGLTDELGSKHTTQHKIARRFGVQLGRKDHFCTFRQMNAWLKMQAERDRSAEKFLRILRAVIAGMPGPQGGASGGHRRSPARRDSITRRPAALIT
jgi:hypothetical protein